MDESHAKAAEFGVPRVALPEEIIADPEIDLILNLTIPAAHANVSIAALESGKHVYSEKPFVTDLMDGRRILDLAREKGLTVSNAPDTFLGGRWQTVRKLLDSGVIGAPTGVAAFVPTRGVERHHPNPDFYYAKGGGPLLDLGPYYLTAMVFLLGPIRQVAAMGKKTFAARMIENGPRNGQVMPVEEDTHCLNLIAFENGVIGEMMVSFDVWESETPRFEIYGEDGTICIPDADPGDGANIFHGPVWYRTRKEARWSMRPRPVAPAEWCVAGTLMALTTMRVVLAYWKWRMPSPMAAPPRKRPLAYHITEAMQAMLTSAREARFVEVASTCARPNLYPKTSRKIAKPCRSKLLISPNHFSQSG